MNLDISKTGDKPSPSSLILDCLPQLGPDGRIVHLTLGMKFDLPDPAGN